MRQDFSDECFGGSKDASQDTINVINEFIDHFAYSDAIFVSECFYRQDPSEKSLLVLADAYFRSGKIVSGYNLLKHSSSSSPRKDFIFAQCCIKLERPIEAEKTLLAVCDWSKNSPRFEQHYGASSSHVYSLLAVSYRLMDRPEKAFKCYKRALELNPYSISSVEGYCQTLESDLNLDSIKGFFQSDAPEKSNQEAMNSLNEREDTRSPNLLKLPSTPSQNSLGSMENTPSPAFALLNQNARLCMAPAPKKNPSKKTKFVSEARKANEENRVRRSARLGRNSLKENNDGTSYLLKDRPLKKSRQLTWSNNQEKPKLIMDYYDRSVNEKETAAVDHVDSQVDDNTRTVASFEQLPLNGIFLSILERMASITAALSVFDWRNALKIIEELPESMQNTPLVLTFTGKAWFEAGQYKKAVNSFEECHRNFDYWEGATDLYSTALWQLENEVELSALAQSLLGKFKDSAQTWSVLGNCLSLQKEHKNAIKCFLRAIQIDSTFTYAYTLLGHEYIALEEFSLAERSFRNAVKINRRHYNAWYGLGQIFCRQEKFSLACANFNRALKENPTNPDLMCNLSAVLHTMNKNDTALKMLDDALKLAPNNVLCRFYRAQQLFSARRYQESMEEVEELKRRSPNEASIFVLAAKIHKALGSDHMAMLNHWWGTEMDPRGVQTNPLRPFDEEPVAALDPPTALTPH